MRSLSRTARSLWRDKTLALASILCFALGVGANSAMFGVTDALLLRPPAGVSDPGHLARVYVTRANSDGTRRLTSAFSYPYYAALHKRPAEVGTTAAFVLREAQVSVNGVARPRVIGYVSMTFSEALGVRPQLGRFFADENDFGSADGVVIGDELWREEFGASPDVLGQNILLGRTPLTVIGVAPPEFGGVDSRRVDVWAPLGLARGALFQPDWQQSRLARWLTLVMRPPSTTNWDVAEAVATSVFRRTNSGALDEDSSASVVLGPLVAARGPLPSRERTIALWLFGISLTVLVIGCTNVAHLMLVRARRRRRDYAIRIALGARAGQLLLEPAREALMLATLGATAAWLVAQLFSSLFRLTTTLEVPVDGRVLLFGALITIMAAVGCGLAPATAIVRLSAGEVIKSGDRSGSSRQSRARRVMVVSQVALSTLLLVSASLIVASARRVTHVERGFAAESVLSVTADPAAVGFSATSVGSLYQKLLTRSRELPGVVQAAIAYSGPFSAISSIAEVSAPGVDTSRLIAASGPAPQYNPVSAEFFTTLGIPVLRGRGFRESDRLGSAPVAVVNEAFAQRYWPGDRAIGRCLSIPDARTTCAEVVGVVKNTLQARLTEQPVPKVFVPIEHDHGFSPVRVLLLRTDGGAAAQLERIRRALQATIPGEIPIRVRSMRHEIDIRERPWRFAALVFTLFGALAIVLSTVGLYGLVSYGVEMRMHEFGIRFALGARRITLVSTVVRSAVAVAAGGLILGLALAVASGRLIAAMLFEVKSTDPRFYFAIAALVVFTAVAGALWPALRAARVAPSEALRSG